MKKQFFAFLFVAISTIGNNYGQENTYIKLGQLAPELAFSDPNGKTLKLSEINKGRLVLLQFWASWAGPARRSNPNVVALQQSYKNTKFKGAKNGFTVVSVSLDQDKNAWIKAIEVDKLSWPFHMSDLGAWQSQAAAAYGVQYIPQAFLIGPDGKIIGKYALPEQAAADIMKLVQ